MEVDGGAPGGQPAPVLGCEHDATARCEHHAVEPDQLGNGLLLAAAESFFPLNIEDDRNADPAAALDFVV